MNRWKRVFFISSLSVIRVDARWKKKKKENCAARSGGKFRSEIHQNSLRFPCGRTIRGWKIKSERMKAFYGRWKCWRFNENSSRARKSRLFEPAHPPSNFTPSKPSRSTLHFVSMRVPRQRHIKISLHCINKGKCKISVDKNIGEEFKPY